MVHLQGRLVDGVLLGQGRPVLAEGQVADVVLPDRPVVGLRGEECHQRIEQLAAGGVPGNVQPFPMQRGLDGVQGRFLDFGAAAGRVPLEHGPVPALGPPTPNRLVQRPGAPMLQARIRPPRQLGVNRLDHVLPAVSLHVLLITLHGQGEWASGLLCRRGPLSIGSLAGLGDVLQERGDGGAQGHLWGRDHGRGAGDGGHLPGQTCAQGTGEGPQADETEE
mmetsp:Transcript_100307/g.173314  ORF Transcript_100307/g.173314 Transcript_100307/m.173314 type:complete len:221 (-) Transcript_100307:95-757(-)